AVAVLPDPELALGPSEARVTPLARRRDGAEYLAALRIELLNHPARELVETTAVEGGAGVRGHREGAARFARCGIERLQVGARPEPSPLPVEGDAMHRFGIGER